MTQLQSVARGLLEAWHGGDPTTLQRQLESTAVLQPALDLPWMEYERGDLLAGIVQSMRKAIKRGSQRPVGCDIEVSVQLLQHLAAEPPRGLRHRHSLTVVARKQAIDFTEVTEPRASASVQ